MFVRVNAIFNTWSVILHEGCIGGLQRIHNLFTISSLAKLILQLLSLDYFKNQAGLMIQFDQTVKSQN